MYDHIQKTMIESGIAEVLEEPVWIDHEQNTVESEMHAFGMKVQAKVVRPDIRFMCNKVGLSCLVGGYILDGISLIYWLMLILYNGFWNNILEFKYSFKITHNFTWNLLS